MFKLLTKNEQEKAKLIWKHEKNENRIEIV